MTYTKLCKKVLATNCDTHNGASPAFPPKKEGIVVTVAAAPRREVALLHGTRGVKMRNKRQAHCGTRSVLHHQGEATKLLIDARADVTRRNRIGQSPLDLARSRTGRNAYSG